MKRPYHAVCVGHLTRSGDSSRTSVPRQVSVLYGGYTFPVADLSRRYLLTLLLRSYQDALPGLHKSGEDIGYISRGKKSGASRTPQHVGESRQLWQQGSYQELNSALHRLAEEDMPAYHAVFLTWVHRRPTGTAWNEHLRFVLRFRSSAERGMKFLEENMPRSIRVPLDVQENAGHVQRPS